MASSRIARQGIHPGFVQRLLHNGHGEQFFDRRPLHRLTTIVGR
jgi:hypothetical protein